MNLDLWGNPINEEQSRRGRRYLRMQEMHGTLRGKTCKTCRHCICKEQNCKFYYKCELWLISCSEATDIRLKDVACGRYEEEI
jgi:hypothetical protein